MFTKKKCMNWNLNKIKLVCNASMQTNTERRKSSVMLSHKKTKYAQTNEYKNRDYEYKNDVKRHRTNLSVVLRDRRLIVSHKNRTMITRATLGKTNCGAHDQGGWQNRTLNQSEKTSGLIASFPRKRKPMTKDSLWCEGLCMILTIRL